MGDPQYRFIRARLGDGPIDERKPARGLEDQGFHGIDGLQSVGSVTFADTVQFARFLRDDPGLQFDYLSNATGVDWPEAITREKRVAMEIIDGQERQIERVIEHHRPGYLEVVYHVYSISLGQGPLIFRQRTGVSVVD